MHWNISLLTACSSGQTSQSTTPANNLTVYTTNESAQFQPLSGINFQTNLVESPNILIDDTIKYQQIEGFGAAITDSSAYLLYSLPEPLRTNTLKTLLLASGIQMSMIRVPISSSDFSLYNYTYDDMPLGMSDITLQNFTIYHDLTYIIPLFKND